MPSQSVRQSCIVQALQEREVDDDPEFLPAQHLDAAAKDARLCQTLAATSDGSAEQVPLVQRAPQHSMSTLLQQAWQQAQGAACAQRHMASVADFYQAYKQALAPLR